MPSNSGALDVGCGEMMWCEHMEWRGRFGEGTEKAVKVVVFGVSQGGVWDLVGERCLPAWSIDALHQT